MLEISAVEPIAGDDSAFRRVSVDHGTLVWPGQVDIAPETLIWDGPCPEDEATRRPEPYLRPRVPALRLAPGQGRERP